MDSIHNEQTNETAECLAWCVAEAYMYYLVAINGRTIYRYETGNIEVSRDFLMDLLDSYLKEENYSPQQRSEIYTKFLKRIDLDQSQSRNTIMVAGKAPQLSEQGIDYMNAFLGRFGEMITELGIQNIDDFLPKNFVKHKQQYSLDA